VWNDSPVFAEIRGGALGGRCGRCEYREVCGGCRARAWAASGDLLAEDASCAYQPEGQREPVAVGRAVTYGQAAELELAWSDEARQRVERIPSFVRGVVSKRVEDYARRNGHAEVTTDLLDAIRRDMPIDFSKKLPFFARQGETPPDE
jgi:AdoMet-dependent heme synthase